MADAAILPVSGCDTNASVRADAWPVPGMQPTSRSTTTRFAAGISRDRCSRSRVRPSRPSWIFPARDAPIRVSPSLAS